jgi:pimeloyl-ACP methyl ester carboxylesterase
MSKRLLSLVVLVAAGVALVAGYRRGWRDSKTPSRIPLTPCEVKGLGWDTSCGRYEVYEDRKAGTGRKIALNVVVLPARRRPAAPDALFLLAGGPGQSIVKAAAGLTFLSRLRETRDIVLVDQRGTGGSGALTCPAAEGSATAEDLPESVVRQCLVELKADPRLYTTDLAMADLDDVRAALGYESIDLWGASYGTRAALVYIKMFPGRVRTAVLDGVAPYGNRLPLYMPRDADRALGLLFRDCAASRDCATAFPDLPGTVRRVYERLRVAPAAVSLRHPLTAQDMTASVSGEAFTSGVRAALYSAEIAALVPFVVTRAEAGDYAPFQAMTVTSYKQMQESMSVALLFSVMCAEDVPFIAREEFDDASMFTSAARRMASVCAFWPKGSPPGDLRRPVGSDVPTLLLSGALDPVTPPSWAEEAAKTLSRSRHLVMPNAGHGISSQGCVPKLLQKFIEDGKHDGLDLGCIEKQRRPPFIVSMAGPRA